MNFPDINIDAFPLLLCPLFAQSGHRSFAVTPLLRLAEVAIKLNLNQHVTKDPALSFFGSAEGEVCDRYDYIENFIK